MTLWQAILLGIVEGLTEFLPISSTGHLILASQFLNMPDTIMKPYVIIIQLGAILAVVFYYNQRVAALFRGLMGREPAGRRLVILLLIAFIPAAIVGLLMDEWIEKRLFGAAPVAWALVVGGILMILVERFITHRRTCRVDNVAEATWQDGFLIGIAQCFSLWPGTSRSMATIVGAQLCGFSNAAAAEFSFLLALPTLGAATLYKLVSAFKEMQSVEGIIPALLIGNIVSFAVAYLAIWGFIKLIARTGMTPFGIYRIVLGLGVAALMAMKWL